MSAPYRAAFGGGGVAAGTARRPATVLLALLLIGIGCRASGSAATPARPAVAPTLAAECFPVERLTAPNRRLAEQILLEFGDREGLYTLAGGLKPVSSDVRNLSIRVEPTLDRDALATLDRLRHVTSALRCGDVDVFVQLFAATFPGRDSSRMRSATLVVAHRRALAETIGRHAEFFGRLGVTPTTDPRDVIAAVDHAPRADRWRGYGLVFGYPIEAVDFFVRAGLEGDSTGQLVPRDFRRIETVVRYPEREGGPAVLSSFVYAVPKGAPESAGDRALREAAAPLHARYVAARAAAIGSDSTGAIALWRTWLALPH